MVRQGNESINDEKTTRFRSYFIQAISGSLTTLQALDIASRWIHTLGSFDGLPVSDITSTPQRISRAFPSFITTHSTLSQTTIYEVPPDLITFEVLNVVAWVHFLT